MATEPMTKREAALFHALQKLMQSDHPHKETAADQLIWLMSDEEDLRAGKPRIGVIVSGKKMFTRDADEIRKHAYAELVRLKLPPDVLAAIRGD